MKDNCSLWLCILAILISSCRKKELPIPAHNPGNVTVSSVALGADYKWQIYYNLKNNTVVGKNLKTDWDLGFESSAEGSHIILNSAKSMFAFLLKDTDFTHLPDTNGMAAAKKPDAPSGSFDSLAIADWKGESQVYILDRGYDELGRQLGYKKIQFVSVDASHYEVRFSGLDGKDAVRFSIPKDSNYNFSFLSLKDKGALVKTEPPKKDWDIAFTQYTHVFHEPYRPYLVTGCLLNRFQTTAAEAPEGNFAGLNYGSIQGLVFSGAMNVIGYGWKTYIGGSYITNIQDNYIIRDRNGLYYKLHFVDFYNASGEKGYPKWEYQQM